MDNELRKWFRFMLENAGYSTPPGRAVCALELARAYVRAENDERIEFVWEDDWDADLSWADPKTVDSLNRGELYCLLLLVRYDGEVENALGGIVVTPDDPYMRVCEAELASETYSNLDSCDAIVHN
jgi:hypothetical protein